MKVLASVKKKLFGPRTPAQETATVPYSEAEIEAAVGRSLERFQEQTARERRAKDEQKLVI